MSITKRQKKILKAIVNEFMDTAEPVGSLVLSEKYDLDVSPATLRSEMADLMDEGYLVKTHSSSGRVPTTLGLRFYLDEMLREDKIDKVIETKIKEKIFQTRFNKSGLMREAAKALSDISDQAGIVLADDIVFSSGLGQLVRNPEFEDMDLLQSALDVLESETTLLSLFEKYTSRGNGLKTLIGDEMDINSMCECSIVYSPFKFFRGQRGFIGVLGPRRMRYARIIPAVRTISEFLERVISGWQ